MEDGSTGFSTALAKNNCRLIEVLLGFYRNNPDKRPDERERDTLLAMDAIKELEKNSEVIETLKSALSGLPPNERRERQRMEPSKE